MARTHASEVHTLQAALRKHKVSITAVLFLLALAYVAIPQLGFFNSNWDTLLASDGRYVGLAVASLLMSFGAASAIYLLLAPQQLHFGKTYIVQIAGAFAGKVLPAGLGSIGVNYLYLRRQGDRQAVAATVVAVNNLLGFVGHGLWLLLVVTLLSGQLTSLSLGHMPRNWYMWAGGAAIALAGLAVVYVLRHHLRRAIAEGIGQLRNYRQQPAKLGLALGASMMLTACNIAIVWCSAQALHTPVTITAAAVALTTGILAQTVTPTPGGLGGVEAGLVAGLLLSGATLEQTVPITMLFRFVTYWLPLALGGVALLVAIRLKFI